MGGLIFGYSIGISGGATSLGSLSKLFPSVFAKQTQGDHQNLICNFDSQLLALFTSCLYLAALVASFVSSRVTSVFGRKISMLVGGTVFVVGAVLNGMAKDVAMLIIDRLLLGVGLGFANQSIPVYLSEMAPANLRGALNSGFQMAITIGNMLANLTNYGTVQIHSTWSLRFSLVLAGLPAILITLGSLFLPDSPTSMLERGYPDKAMAILKRVRGTDDVRAEFDELVNACDAAKKVEHRWRNIMQRKYRPQLVICCLVPFFQQLTGINVIMFYAPILFKTLGFRRQASLMAAVITGAVNVGATGLSIFFVDRFGRRKLFLEGGVQMILCQVIIGIMIALKFGTSATGQFSKFESDVLVVLICLYVAGFAWSWGPLGLLVPSEVCPLEIKSAGQTINVSMNMLFTFVIGQFFLSMLCHMKFGQFLFFAGWIVIMTIFIFFFLSETKNIPIEEMDRVWKDHWYWSRYFSEDGDQNARELSVI